jgi:phospholipid/cholesterol/gamma-HCH transport system permease protein
MTLTDNFIADLGAWAIGQIRYLGRMALFFLESFILIFSIPPQVSRTLEQISFIGAKSMFVILLTGAFTGMVLGLQGYYALVKFGAEGMLGSAVALSLIREMGPVLTAIMIVGRAGSAMTAEIGIMRISEQIDALQTMNVNPVRFLVTPRLTASILSFPLLTAVFDVVGIFGGYVTGSLLLGINKGIFFSRVHSSVMMTDINGGFVKAVAFALVVNTICCFKGYYTHLQENGHGAKGVSQSTTSAVVLSCVVILIVDYILTSFLL